ncbi:UNVERIFIED_ORG: ornithine cyclodeaminase [Shinella sp. XGS7]|nr:ornithine cyclodeaminase [Shinella sp. XGS7]
MTRFIDVPALAELLQRKGVAPLMAELADTLREDFLRWEEFDKTPRVASHSEEGVIELMPTSDGTLYGFKYVNGHPKNTRDGRQTVTAFGVLSDVGNGYPMLLTEMTILTALRTAATSAVAAKYLARPNARTMAIIGNGAQSEFQARAFHSQLGIREIVAYDIDPAATDKLQRNLAGFADLQVLRASSVAEAVRGADIVTTVTADKQYATILSDNHVGPGVHINAVGGDCPGKTELSKDILLRSDIFVEYPPQTRIEGEIQQLPAEHPVIELWQVMTGEVEGRRSADQITLFDSVGFAIEDYSTLRLLDRLARELGVGREVQLVPPADDPKDLFRHTRSGRAQLRRAA